MKSGNLLCCGVVALGALCNAAGAWADLTISSKATSNMSCSNGTCEPTASKAVLNAGDLQNYIAEFGNMTVQTTGNGVEAHNIVVDAAFASPGSTTLNLDAHDAIKVNASVTIGSGGQLSELELVSESGGELGAISFGSNGSIAFGSTPDIFGINGGIFTLVDSLPNLASAIASNPGGFYALANSYDAKADGTYHSAPVATVFTGYFEALGNAISHVKIKDSSGENVGLFAEIDGSNGFGTIRNLRLENVSVEGGGRQVGSVVGSVDTGAAVSQSSVSGTVKDVAASETAGGLVGVVFGTIVSSWSSVKVTGGTDNSATGGLAGANYGTISNSYATGVVAGGNFIGGLVGVNEDSTPTISGSFATGAVETAGGGNGAYAGGLVGAQFGIVANCYAMGSVTDTGNGTVLGELGGLVGFELGDASDSYATGAVTGPGSDQIGGVVGYDETNGGFSDAYWDVTTSGVSQGAGNIDNDPGLTGLTTRQLKSGLPAGFEKSIWKEKNSINRGFPILIQNLPPK